MILLRLGMIFDHLYKHLRARPCTTCSPREVASEKYKIIRTFQGRPKVSEEVKKRALSKCLLLERS